MPEEKEIHGCDEIVPCPYCGMIEWVVLEFVSKKGSENVLVRCVCRNCGRMFYLLMTRLKTFTYKAEDVQSPRRSTGVERGENP